MPQQTHSANQEKFSSTNIDMIDGRMARKSLGLQDERVLKTAGLHIPNMASIKASDLPSEKLNEFCSQKFILDGLRKNGFQVSLSDTKEGPCLILKRKGVLVASINMNDTPPLQSVKEFNELKPASYRMGALGLNLGYLIPYLNMTMDVKPGSKTISSITLLDQNKDRKPGLPVLTVSDPKTVKWILGHSSQIVVDFDERTNTTSFSLKAWMNRPTQNPDDPFEVIAKGKIQGTNKQDMSKKLLAPFKAAIEEYESVYKARWPGKK